MRFNICSRCNILSSKQIEVSTKSKLMSSAARALRDRVAKEFPLLEPYIDEIIPKKEDIYCLKCRAYSHH